MDKSLLGAKNQNQIKQLYHYALVGIASNLSGYIVYLLAIYFGGTPKITMTILYAVGATIGFYGNSMLTFTYKGSLLGSGIRYIIAHCFGYCINLMILVAFVDTLGYTHQLVQAIAIVFVAAFLFLVFKFFVFTDSGISGAKGR